jgi:conjugal transfer/entry exclusion protein
MRNVLKSTVLAIALMAAIGSAHAGGAAGIVFDPTNFAKNLITATQTTKAALESATQTAQQIRMVANWAINLKQHGAEFLLSKIDPELLKHAEDVVQFQRSLKDLESDLDNLHRRFEVKAKAAWSEKMTVDDFMKWQKEQADRGIRSAQVAVNADVASLKRVEKTYAAVRDWQEKIPGIAGSVQGLQLLNSQMNAMVAQNAEIVTALTRQSLNATLAQQERLTNEAISREAMQRAERKALEDAKAIAAKRKADFEGAIDNERFTKQGK